MIKYEIKRNKTNGNWVLWKVNETEYGLATFPECVGTKNECVIRLKEIKEHKNEPMVSKQELQNRINNAIIKLEDSQRGLEEWHFDGYDPDLPEIINILKGIENEENN